MHLSFVIPVYNEAKTLIELVEGILQHAGTANLEILLIDDGSTDESPQIIAELARTHPVVTGIALGRRLGKTQALKTGFEAAKGNIVLTMDSDLQDDPAEIPAFLARLDEGCDLVVGWKQRRHDPSTRVFASALYNVGIRRLFGIQLRDVNCGFKAMRREVAKTLAPQLKRDYHRLIPVLAHRAGFRIAEIPVTHHPRRHGRSKYGPSRYIQALVDAILLKIN